MIPAIPWRPSAPSNEEDEFDGSQLMYSSGEAKKIAPDNRRRILRRLSVGDIRQQYVSSKHFERLGREMWRQIDASSSLFDIENSRVSKGLKIENYGAFQMLCWTMMESASFGVRNTRLVCCHKSCM